MVRTGPAERRTVGRLNPDQQDLPVTRGQKDYQGIRERLVAQDNLALKDQKDHKQKI